MQSKCPHCQTVLDVSPFATGTVIACANCQQNLTVPAPVAQPEAVSIVPTPKKPRRKAQQKVWKQPAVIICAFVGFFLISGCCIFSSVLDYNGLGYTETAAPPVTDSKPEPDEPSIREVELWRKFESRKNLGDSYFDDKDYQNAKECYLDGLFVLEAIEEINPDSEHATSYGDVDDHRLFMNSNILNCNALGRL